MCADVEKKGGKKGVFEEAIKKDLIDNTQIQ